MAVKLGNDYLIFVATPGGTPSYLMLGGQQSGTFNDARNSSDGSHKTSGGFNLSIAGNRTISIDLGFVADLPDTGYSLVEAAYAANTPLLVQMRDAGASSAIGDAVFTCEMRAFNRNVETPLNGTVTGSFTFQPSAAPTLDLTL